MMDLSATRQYLLASMPLDGALPEPYAVEGITIRPYNRPEDDGPCVVAFNQAFFGEWQHQPQTLSDWKWKTGQPHFLPDISWVAEPADVPGMIVGMSLCCVTPCTLGTERSQREAWIDILGTIPDWRGIGIGKTLLLHSLRSMKSAGFKYALLGVDSEAPLTTVALYTSAGFRVPGAEKVQAEAMAERQRYACRIHRPTKQVPGDLLLAGSAI